MLALIACLAAWAGPYDDGVVALRQGRFIEAKAKLEQAVASEDRTEDAWWELGWAHWTLEEYDGSVRAWEQVRQINPTREELEHWLAAAQTRVTLGKGAPKLTSVVETPLDGERLHVVAVGDTMMGTDLRRGPSGLPPDDGQSIFAPIRSSLRDADVTFINLEGPLADGLPSKKCRPDSTACYAFRTPTRFTAGLVDAGVDVASLANNHAMDLGTAGQESTMAALDAAGIAHAGRYGDIGTVEHGDLKIAFVAAHSGSCCLNVNRIAEVQQAIVLADRDHDLVVFSFHGGAEGNGARRVPGKTEIAWGERRGDVRALSRAAVDAGADLVLGHGPHVLRAMEVYRGRLIAYSLGNFVGYKQFGRGQYTGTSAILHAEMAPNGVIESVRIEPLVLDDRSSPVPDPSGQAIEQINELSTADFPESGLQLDAEGRWRATGAAESQ